MDNPWRSLPEDGDLVLECDKDQILAFNDKEKCEDYRIHLDLLPEPYLGNPEAGIILLNGNPGFSADDATLHRTDEFRTASRINLVHGEQEYPFYFLDPEIVKARGRRRFWSKGLRELIEEFGEFGALTVANNVFCIEFFPYHSKKSGKLGKMYNSPRGTLPSQSYSFNLARMAIRRGALIVLMRAKKEWLKAVPELIGYPYYCELNNPQCGYVSRGNLPEGGFAKVVEVLNSNIKRSLI